jgi:hypothetical protein
MYRPLEIALRSTTAVPPFAVQPPAQAVAQEYLPFTVRVVDTEAALHKAVQIRHAAYARHIAPHLALALQAPEALDRVPGAVVLLAESKVDGSPLGTMRIQTNRHGPLTLEQSVELPQWMQGLGLAEASRLGITQEKVGRMVKTVLFKAFYLYCLHNGIAHMVITARSPVDRMYDRLLFQDVYPGMGYVPLEHVFNLPHRIMQLDVQRAQAMWQDAGHPLLGFMCDTEHPDLMV